MNLSSLVMITKTKSVNWALLNLCLMETAASKLPSCGTLDHVWQPLDFRVAQPLQSNIAVVYRKESHSLFSIKQSMLKCSYSKRMKMQRH